MLLVSDKHLSHVRPEHPNKAAGNYPTDHRSSASAPTTTTVQRSRRSSERSVTPPTTTNTTTINRLSLISSAVTWEPYSHSVGKQNQILTSKCAGFQRSRLLCQWQDNGLFPAAETRSSRLLCWCDRFAQKRVLSCGRLFTIYLKFNDNHRSRRHTTLATNYFWNRVTHTHPQARLEKRAFYRGDSPWNFPFFDAIANFHLP